MLKKLLNGVIITIIVALGLSIVGMFVLDGVAQSVIQNKGSEGLGVPIKFGHIHVGVFSHKSSFSDLKIGNPEKGIKIMELLKILLSGKIWSRILDRIQAANGSQKETNMEQKRSLKGVKMKDHL